MGFFHMFWCLLCLTVPLFLSLSLSLCLSLSFFLSLFLTFSLSLNLYIYLAFNLYIYLSPLPSPLFPLSIPPLLSHTGCYLVGWITISNFGISPAWTRRSLRFSLFFFRIRIPS
jgi:hypothetical protein